MSRDPDVIYGKRINEGIEPDFYVALVILDILREEEEVQRERHPDYNDIVRTITSRELMGRLAHSDCDGIGKVKSRKACRIARAFLKMNNLDYEPKYGKGKTIFSQITYTPEQLKAAEAWAMGVAMRRLFYS